MEGPLNYIFTTPKAKATHEQAVGYRQIWQNTRTRKSLTYDHNEASFCHVP